MLPTIPNRSVKATTPFPLRHEGYCGQREQCWRDECRAEWGSYNTVEVFPGGDVIAFCHGLSATPADVRRERWRAETVAA